MVLARVITGKMLASTTRNPGPIHRQLCVHHAPLVARQHRARAGPAEGANGGVTEERAGTLHALVILSSKCLPLESVMQGRVVAAHAHGKGGIIVAMKAGARTIEYGSYVDQEAAELMVKHVVALVATAHITHTGPQKVDRMPPETAAKLKHIAGIAPEAYCTVVRAGVRIAIGTDICPCDSQDILSPRHSCEELHLTTEMSLSQLQAIEAVTFNSAETLEQFASKNGPVEVGWDADLIASGESPL